MFGIKNLKEKINRLENEMNVYKNELYEQVELTKFLLEHDKNEVVVTKQLNHIYLGLSYEIVAKYIKDGKLVTTEKDCNTSIYSDVQIVEVKNISDNITLINLKEFGRDKYLQLNKCKEELSVIEPEIANILKENKKESTKTGKVKANPNSAINIEENNAINKDVPLKWNTVEKQEEKPKYVKNGIKYNEPKYSLLLKYYDTYNLNLGIKNFKPIKRLSEKEAATLLYLFDKYKYVEEIMKHIKLSRATLNTYAYVLRKAGYLVFSKEMGRVANGCLIYKTV